MEVIQDSRFEEEEDECQLEFVKRSGVENDGWDYEAVMTALYALKLVLQENVSKVVIASNLHEYGVFDDIIIRVEYKGVRRPKLYLMQLKNKMKDISTNEFYRKGDFWLKKYKDCYYKDIKKKLRDADGLTEGISEDDIVMCLLTNASIKGPYMFPLETHLICSKFSHNHLEDVINTKSDGCYKFEVHRSFPKRSQFLHKLLRGNFCSEGDDDYENIIKQILNKLRKNTVTNMTLEKFEKVKPVTMHFRKELKAALVILDTKPDGNMEYNNFVSELFATNHNLIEREILDSDRDFFKKISVDKFSEVVSQYTNKISDSKARSNRSDFQNIFERIEAYLLYKYKLGKEAEYSAFYKRFLFYSGQVNVREAEEKIASLLEKSFGQVGSAVTEQFLKYIKAHFKPTRYFGLTKRDIKMKLLELLTGLTDAIQLKERYKIFENITDMYNYNQRIYILKEVKVSIQGRQEINLVEFASKSFHEKISAGFLLKNLGQIIHVGLQENLKPDIYVKRKFFKILLRSDALRKMENNVFIFAGEKSTNSTNSTGLRKVRVSYSNHMEKNNLVYNLEGRRVSDAVNDIKPLRENSPIHLYIHSGKYLEWQRSWNSIKDLGDFLVEDECVDEHEVLQYFSGGLNIVSAAPGMGKTTVLHALANYCRPDVLVLKLDLNARYNDLRENNHLKTNPLSYLWNLMKSPSVEPEMKIFEDLVFQYCLEENRLIVFIDAFDEIISESAVLETTLSIIEQLRDRKITVWLFTRPLALPYIQDKYKVLAINMAGFTEDDIKFYLSKKLTATEQAKLSKFLTGNSLTLYSVPHYLQMLVSICDQSQSITLENLKTTDLYDRFVRMTFDKYCKVHGIDVQRNNFNRNSLYQEYSKIHKVAALCVIYGRDYLIKNKIFSEEELNNVLAKFSESENNFGLVVTVRGGSPIFFHRTNAEYWTALWLFDSYSMCSNQVSCSCQHHGMHRGMYEYLFDPQFKSIRLMFDVLASQERKIHSAVLEGDFDKVKEELQKKFSKDRYIDKFGRTPLHLAMGYISQNDNESITISISIAKELAVYAKRNNCCLHQSDKILRWNCYKYAKASGVKYLLHKFSEWDSPEILKFTIQPSKRCFPKCNRKILSAFFTFERKNLKALVNEKDLNTRRVLHVASEFGSTSCVRYLIKVGAEVNSETRTQSTPMHLAAQKGNVEVLKLLCANGGKVNVFDKNKYTPLHLASFHGHPDCVKYLIEMHGNADATINLSALRIAVEQGHLNILELLYMKISDINVVDEQGHTLLHLAARAGQIECVRYLIQLHCNVNAKTKPGNTSMHLAASMGYCDVLKLLHENGGKIGETNSAGTTSLHEAIRKGHKDCVRYLMQVGADVNAANYLGLTPVHIVAIEGSTDSLRYLIQSGADIDSKDKTGKTAMHFAALNGRTDCLRLLIENGGNFNLKDSEGYTVLHSASSSGHIACVQYLIDEDFNVNNPTESEENTTAMCLAAKGGHTGVLKILTEAGGDFHLADSYGRTPLRLAVENGRTDCARYLRTHCGAHCSRRIQIYT